jgi:hypothetical protein
MASTTVVCRRRRFRWGLFLVSMWLLLARARINFPVPVRLNRFAAARLVFILGIAFSITPGTKPGLQFRNSPPTPRPFHTNMDTPSPGNPLASVPIWGLFPAREPTPRPHHQSLPEHEFEIFSLIFIREMCQAFFSNLCYLGAKIMTMLRPSILGICSTTDSSLSSSLIRSKTFVPWSV